MSENTLARIENIQPGTMDYKKIMLIYESALKEVETKIDIISNEFKTLYQYNPIEHVKTRIKSYESIVGKLQKKGLTVSYDNMINILYDIAGIRIICSFVPDVYKIVEMLQRIKGIKIIKSEDYIVNPKKSGYSSYHIVVLVPVSFSSTTINVKVEIQIRTMAMDFWASLEHKIKYKYKGEIPERVSTELVECAKMTMELDHKMANLGENAIQQLANSMKLEDRSLNENYEPQWVV